MKSFKFEVTGEIVIQAPSAEAAEQMLRAEFNSNKEMFNIGATAYEVPMLSNVDVYEEYAVNWK